RRMGILVLLGIVRVADPELGSEGLDRERLAGEELPVDVIATPEATDEGVTLLGGILRRLARVDRDGEHAEVPVARGPIELREGLPERVQLHAANDATAIIVEREEDRLLAVEEVAELHRAPQVIA